MYAVFVIFLYARVQFKNPFQTLQQITSNSGFKWLLDLQSLQTWWRRTCRWRRRPLCSIWPLPQQYQTSQACRRSCSGPGTADLHTATKSYSSSVFGSCEGHVFKFCCYFLSCKKRTPLNSSDETFGSRKHLTVKLIRLATGSGHWWGCDQSPAAGY